MEMWDRPFADDGPVWYAMHTRNQHEPMVESDLRARGFEPEKLSRPIADASA